MEITEIVTEIKEKIDNYYDKKRKRYPAHTNWASNLGHPCLRFLVHARLDWTKKDLPDLMLQKIFEEGKIHEKAVRNLFDEIGVTIIRGQEPFTWEDYQISGRSEGIVRINSKRMPIEIKGMSPNAFSTINSLEDMKVHSKYYVRGYITQLMIYMLQAEQEEGFYIIKNKLTGDIKLIPCILDYDFAESFLKKAEKVNEFVAKAEYPDRMEYDPDICDECWFRTVCQPDKIVAEEAHIEENSNFLTLLNRRAELKPYSKEYNEVDKKVKEFVKASKRNKILAGDFLITATERERKGYTVAPFSYTDIRIKNLDGGK